MQKTSYNALAASRSHLEKELTTLGIELEKNSWLCRAYELVDQLSKLYQDDTQRHEFMEQENGDGEVYFSLLDTSFMKDTLHLFQSENADILKRKFKKILKMSSPPLETQENNEARNTLWELKLLSQLKTAGIKAHLGEPNPDILAYFGSRKYYIQCKRAYSSRQDTLRKNIINAVHQLERDLADENQDALGIVALSFERPLTKGSLMLITESKESGKEKLFEIVKEFISLNGHLWQDPSLIRDRRIVGIVLHIAVPSIVEGENIFASASQIVINNTWADGSGFEAIAKDFGPLKQVMES